MTTLFSRGFPQRNAKHPLQDVIPGIISVPGACRSSHIHSGPIEVWQGWVDDAVVRIGGCPLEAEYVWLTEQLQQDAILQAAPAAHDKPQSMDAEDEKVSSTFTACSLRVSRAIPASFRQTRFTLTVTLRMQESETHLNVAVSLIADHRLAQLRRKMPGVDATVLSTLWSCGE